MWILIIVGVIVGIVVGFIIGLITGYQIAMAPEGYPED